MKVIVKSITEVHATDAAGNVREHDVEIVDAHGEGAGKHERKPVVDRVEVVLADEKGTPVATHLLAPGDPELKGLKEGDEYEGPHTYEHAAAAE